LGKDFIKIVLVCVLGFGLGIGCTSKNSRTSQRPSGLERTAPGERDPTVESQVKKYAIGTTTIGNGAISLLPLGGVYDEGALVIATIQPAAGYRFDHWSYENESASEFSEDGLSLAITVHSDLFIAANLIQQFNLTSSVSGLGSLTADPIGGLYDYGSVVTLTATPVSGNVFDSWSGDLSGSTSPITVTMDSAKNIAANFLPLLNYSIEVLGGVGGTVSVVGQDGTSKLVSGSDIIVLKQGVDLSLAANAAAGYQFSHWEFWDAQGNPVLNGTANVWPDPIATLVGDQSRRAVAHFSAIVVPPQTYMLTTNVVGQGTVVPGSSTYNAGQTVNLSAIAALGWVFDHWSGGATGSSTVTSVAMNANKSVTATFVLVYSLTATVSTGQGTIQMSPPGGRYVTGTAVSLTPVPAEGYVFSGWTGDLSGDANPGEITVNGNKAVQARFTLATPGGVNDAAIRLLLE